MFWWIVLGSDGSFFNQDGYQEVSSLVLVDSARKLVSFICPVNENALFQALFWWIVLGSPEVVLANNSGIKVSSLVLVDSARKRRKRKREELRLRGFKPCSGG